jgi:hypothetical protein
MEMEMKMEMEMEMPLHMGFDGSSAISNRRRSRAREVYSVEHCSTHMTSHMPSVQSPIPRPRVDGTGTESWQPPAGNGNERRVGATYRMHASKAAGIAVQGPRVWFGQL